MKVLFVIDTQVSKAMGASYNPLTYSYQKEVETEYIPSKGTYALFDSKSEFYVTDVFSLLYDEHKLVAVLEGTGTEDYFLSLGFTKV